VTTPEIVDDAVAVARVVLRLIGERDRARDIAVRLEQENAHLREVLDGLLLWAEQQPGFDATKPLILGARP
jgi:hypothetical protein